MLTSGIAVPWAFAQTSSTDNDDINGPGGLMSLIGSPHHPFSPAPSNPLQIKEHPPAHILKFIGSKVIKPSQSSGTLSAPYGPTTIWTAYGFNSLSCGQTGSTWPSSSLCGNGQTIAIVDAYYDANIASDLSTFDTEFGLPACTTTNGCLAIDATGTGDSSSWALETSLDVEWAHSIAPGAKIVLVESADNSLGNLLNGESTAAASGAQQVSNSWGSSEFSGETSYDSYFNSPTTSFFVSSGDGGNGVEWPAASPYVVSVGGTTLTLSSSGTWQSETAWTDSGGGISTYESKPTYQNNLVSGNYRAVPDVAYDGNPNTGLYVYDSVPINGESGWWEVGGTSAGTPQWTAISAIANSQGAKLASVGADTALYGAAAGIPSGTPYTSNYHDITSGNNGNCGTVCNAGPGYDEVTGLGSPQANDLIPYLSGPLTPTFTVSSSPSSLTISPSGSGSSAITVSSINGFSGTVSFSVSAASGSATLASPSVTVPAGGSATDALSISAPATSGIYSITVTGTSGSLTQSTTVTVTVPTPTPTLSVSVSANKASYSAGTTADITVTVTSSSKAVNHASVALTVTESNGSAAKGSGTTNSNGQVTFAYSISRNAPAGTYTAAATASASGYTSGSGSTTFGVASSSTQR